MGKFIASIIMMSFLIIFFNVFFAKMELRSIVIVGFALVITELLMHEIFEHKE